MTSKEALERYYSNLLFGCGGFSNDQEELEALKVIKQDLDKLEKLEKVIKIIKEEFDVEIDNEFWINMLHIESGFGVGACLKDKKDKYELLKEVFGNEN